MTCNKIFKKQVLPAPGVFCFSALFVVVLRGLHPRRPRGREGRPSRLYLEEEDALIYDFILI
jgi:hypothetical protein